MQRSIQFILSLQRPDGDWSENPLLTISPDQNWLINHCGITWLTADIVELLRLAGLSTRFEYLAAVEFLKSLQNQDGSWPSVAPNRDVNQFAPGDPYTTAKTTFLMCELFGEDDPIYHKGKLLFESYLDECAHGVERGYRTQASDGKTEEIETYHLTHLLLSWILDPPHHFYTGYDVRDPRVKRMMEALIDIQCQDGCWCPFWTGESSLSYTVLAIKVLVMSGMLVCENLSPDVN